MDGRRGQQLAFANGNNPPSTTLIYTISRFTTITPPKRGGAGPGKTVYGDGAWKMTGNMEEGRPDEVGRISIFGVNKLKFVDADPGWKIIGSGIRDGKLSIMDPVPTLTSVLRNRDVNP